MHLIGTQVKVLSVKHEQVVIEAEDNDMDLRTWIEENAINECIEFTKVLNQLSVQSFVEAAAAANGADKMNYGINEDAYTLLPVIIKVLKEKKDISGDQEGEMSPEI